MVQRANSKTKQPRSWFRFSLFVFLLIFNFSFALDGTVLAKPVASDQGDGGGGGGGGKPAYCKRALEDCLSQASTSYAAAAATCAAGYWYCPPCVSQCEAYAALSYAGIVSGCYIGYSMCG